MQIRACPAGHVFRLYSAASVPMALRGTASPVQASANNHFCEKEVVGVILKNYILYDKTLNHQ